MKKKLLAIVITLVIGLASNMTVLAGPCGGGPPPIDPDCPFGGRGRSMGAYETIYVDPLEEPYPVEGNMFSMSIILYADDK